MIKIAFTSWIVLGTCLLGASQGQETKPSAESTRLTARMEVTNHEQGFAVRFFIKNDGDQDTEVVYGRGGMGMSVVPQFQLGDLTITPATYLRPGRRAMNPDKKAIPAGKEILYGTFMMGYPLELEQGLRPDKTPMGQKITGSIRFAQSKITLKTEPQWLKRPEKK